MYVVCACVRLRVNHSNFEVHSLLTRPPYFRITALFSDKNPYLSFGSVTKIRTFCPSSVPLFAAKTAANSNQPSVHHNDNNNNHPATATMVRTPVEFNQSWIVKFGLEVSTRDVGTSKVTSVLCLFCNHCGRDDGDDDDDDDGQTRKRKRTTNIKYFTSP